MPKPRGRNISATEICARLGVETDDSTSFDVRPPSRQVRAQSPVLNQGFQVCSRDYTKIAFNNCQRAPSPQARGQVGNLDPCEINLNRGYQPYSSDGRPFGEPVVDRRSQLNLEYEMARNKQFALERLCAEEAQQIASQPRPALAYVSQVRDERAPCPMPMKTEILCPRAGRQERQEQQQQSRPQAPAGPARTSKSPARAPNLDQLFALNLANYNPPGTKGRPFDPNRDVPKRRADVPADQGVRAASGPVPPQQGDRPQAFTRMPRTNAPAAQPAPRVFTSTPKSAAPRAQLVTSPAALPSAPIAKASKGPPGPAAVMTTVTTTTTTKKTVEGSAGRQQSATRGVPPPPLPSQNVPEGRPAPPQAGARGPAAPQQTAARGARTAINQQTQGTHTVINQQTQATRIAINQQTQAPRTAINQQTQAARTAINQQTQGTRTVINQKTQAARTAIDQRTQMLIDQQAELPPDGKTPPNVTPRRFRDLPPWPEPESVVVSECEDPGLDAAIFKPAVRFDTRTYPTPPHSQLYSETSSSIERSVPLPDSSPTQSLDRNVCKTYSSETQSSSQTLALPPPPSPIKTPPPSPDSCSPDRRIIKSVNRSRSCVLPGTSPKKEFIVHENVVDLTEDDETEARAAESGTSDYCARTLAYHRAPRNDGKFALTAPPPVEAIAMARTCAPMSNTTTVDVIDLTDDANYPSNEQQPIEICQPLDDGSQQASEGNEYAGPLTIQRHQGRIEAATTVCQQQPRASLFRCLAKKLSSTYDFLSSMVATQKQSDMLDDEAGDMPAITGNQDLYQIEYHPSIVETCEEQNVSRPPTRSQTCENQNVSRPPTRSQTCENQNVSRPPTRSQTCENQNVSRSPTRSQVGENMSRPPTRSQVCEDVSRSPTRSQVCENVSRSPTRTPRLQTCENQNVSRPPTRSQVGENMSRPPTRSQVCENVSRSPTRSQVCETVSRSPTRPPTIPPRAQVGENVNRPPTRPPKPQHMNRQSAQDKSQGRDYQDSGTTTTTTTTTVTEGYRYRGPYGECPDPDFVGGDTTTTDYGLRTLYGAKAQLPAVPEAVKDCSMAKRCGRVQFDKTDKNQVQDFDLATRRKAELDTLVKDAYCPGIIQETVDGQEDFNRFAIKLTGNPEEILSKVRPPDDPMTLLEAFSIRIDNERTQIDKDIPDNADQEQIATVINDYFNNQNPTDLNRSIKSLMISEHLQQHEDQEKSKGISLEADVQKLVTPFPDNDVNKFIFYTGHTKPVAEETDK